MFIRRTDGPVSVILSDGSRMTRADLPPPDTRRWVASRKAAVVRAVAHGLITPGEACKRYGLSEEEFNSWCRAMAAHGEKALRTTALKTYRQPEGERNKF